MTGQQRLAERMANLPSYVIKTHDIARGLRMSDEEYKSMADIIARARDCILEAGEILDRVQNVFEQQLNDIAEVFE